MHAYFVWMVRVKVHALAVTVTSANISWARLHTKTYDNFLEGEQIPVAGAVYASVKPSVVGKVVVCARLREASSMVDWQATDCLVVDAIESHFVIFVQKLKKTAPPVTDALVTL